MDKQICIRCNSKEAVFNCLMCDSFKTLCLKCDSYIHSLPSKRMHKRLAIEEVSETTHETIIKPKREYHVNTSNENVCNISSPLNMSNTFSREYLTEIKVKLYKIESS
jgi:hypothetical protein